MQSGERFGEARALRHLLAICVLAVVLLAGSDRALALGKAGDVDPTFHGGAPVLADLAKTVPRVTYFSDLVVDGSGRIVVAGSSSDASGNTALALARYGADGALDPGFAEGGSRVLQLGTAYSFAQNLFRVPGRYVGLGLYRTVSGAPDQSAYVIGEDGFGDLGFGNSVAGLATTSFPSPISSSGAAAAPDGTIYVSGTYGNTNSNYALQVNKFTPAGQVASNFPGFAGGYTKQFGQNVSSAETQGGPVATLPDGSLVTGGMATLPGGGYGLLVVHLSPGGTLYGSFGEQAGFSVVDASDFGSAGKYAYPYEVVVGPDREIYFVGTALDAAEEKAAMIARFTPSGQRDYTFGSGGIKRIQLAGVGESSAFFHIDLQPDGKIVAFADAGKGGGRIVRLLEDGSLDPNFGAGGVVTPNFGGTESGTSGGAIVGNRLLVAGWSVTAGRTYGVLAAYLLGPLPDPPPPTAGRGSLKLRRKTLRVDAKGRVGIPLTCSAAGPCKGRLALIAKTGKATVSKAKKAKVYAKRSYSLAAGAKKTITLKVSKPARARAAAKAGFRIRLALAPEGAKAQLLPVTLRR